MINEQSIHGNAKSIAVLPFVNMSSDPDNEYFSDGMTEEIINALTTIQGLKVIARTSSFAFKNKNIDVRTIGRQLGVSTVLEGSVRKAHNRVRITAQLINTHDGAHLWSENFDRELDDIFTLQDEVSLLIADQIRENFGHLVIQDHLIDAPTNSTEAYNLYLKGRYHQLKWNAKDLLAGADYYERSIKKDPTFALPYFGAALTYGINASWGFTSYEEGIQRAAELLESGLKINDKAYLGHFAQGTVFFWGKWDFKKGHECLQRAIEANPAFTDAEEGLAELCTAIGAFKEALHHTQNILNINPLSPNHYYTEGNIYYLSGDYEKAIQSLKTGLKVDPQFALATEMIALCFIQLKDYKSLVEFLSHNPQAQHPGKCMALFKLMYPDVEQAEVHLPEIRTHIKEDNSASLIAWNLYTQVYLGQHEQALDVMEKRIKMRSGQLINFKHDPFFAPLHSHVRYKKLVATIFHPKRLPILEKNRFTQVDSSKSVLSTQQVEYYVKEMAASLEKEQAFLDPSLSLKLLAERIDLHPNKLSWLLNEHIGKNFNEYINTFRLEAFKVKALDQRNSHLSLLGLAYESGFNSKSAFNSFFKKMEGVTPRVWVRSQQSSGF